MTRNDDAAFHVDRTTASQDNSRIQAKASPTVSSRSRSLDHRISPKLSLSGESVMKHRVAVLSLIALALLFVGADATAQTYTVLHNYPIGSGAYSGIQFPQVMSQGRDGKLYSTISNNGAKNVGSVFNITTGGSPTTIYSFCSLTSCTDGSYPFGGVTLGFDGNLHGTTQGGGGAGKAGTVFKITPTGTLTTQHAFGNATDDSVPVYATLQGQDGNTYGVSVGQYVGQNGAFFKVSSTGVFTVLHDFTYTDGANPNLPTQG